MLVIRISAFGPGEPLPAHQAAWRLLLLRQRAARKAQQPRLLLRQHGPAHDTGDTRRTVQRTGKHHNNN